MFGRGDSVRADDRSRSILFAGLSSAGHGGIQEFNRRVAAALRAMQPNATTIMLAELGHLRFAARVLAALRADLLLIGHVNLLPLAWLHRLVRPSGARILFAHGIEVWGDSAYRAVRWWESWLLRRAVGRVAVVSRYSQRRMMAAFGLGADRFTLFPNAVDLPPAVRRDRSGRTILAVTRLGAGEREKHVDKLVRALPTLRDARLVVIGEGPLRTDLHALAATLDVADRVDLPGGVDAATLAQAYADAAVFALPSSKEGFGIVYLEAWGHGLPVIGSRFGAAGEVIADGVDGFTVDPDDVAVLAARLRQLLDDPERAAEMGAAGRAKVARLYSGDAFVANLRALLDAARRDPHRPGADE